MALRRLFIIVKNHAIPIITVNNSPYNYGDSYEEGSTLNIKIAANGYSDFIKQITMPNSNLALNVELAPISNFVDLTSDQTITGVKTFDSNVNLNGIFNFVDSNNSNAGWIESYSDDEKEGIRLGVGDSESPSGIQYLGVEKQFSDSTYHVATTSEIRKNITKWAFPNKKTVQLTMPPSATGMNMIAPDDGWFTCRLYAGNQSNTISFTTGYLSIYNNVTDGNCFANIQISKNQNLAYKFWYGTPNSNAASNVFFFLLMQMGIATK